MSRNIVNVADLSQYNNNCVYNLSIKVAVSIKSIEHFNGEFNYFYMDLRDGSGEISAVAYNDASERLHNFIKKNKTYIITRFYISNSNGGYTSILHEKQIVLVDDTEVTLCGAAAKIQWPYCYQTRRRKFYNITAVCTDAGETEVYSSNKLIRKITLLDEDCDVIILYVWNEETKLFDYVNCDSYPVLFVKDARVCAPYDEDDDHGDFCVKSTRYVLWLDSNDPRARTVREAVQSAQVRSSSNVSYYDSSDDSDDY